MQELADYLTAKLIELDHDELTEVENKAKGPGSETEPHNHVLIKVTHASGATSAVQVKQVSGPGISPAPEYRIPKDGW